MFVTLNMKRTVKKTQPLGKANDSTPKAELFSSDQVQTMIQKALENHLTQLETLKILTSKDSSETNAVSSSVFTVRTFRDDEILIGRKNYKSWKRMIINDLEALELSECIESEDGNMEWSEPQCKKLKA